VHLVDDDGSFLRAMARMLSANGLETRTYESANQLLSSITMESRGCVIADLQMPGLSGFDLQERLRDSPAPMPLIFLTCTGDIPASVKAMRQGAVDFLEKRVPAESLLRSVRSALAQDEADCRERARRASLEASFSRLTERELQVLRLVVAGQMIKQIAAELGINERTVKLHRTAITRKTGVHSAAQLALLTREAGLFPPEQ
jgi:FixJ family two-component response regulator